MVEVKDKSRCGHRNYGGLPLDSHSKRCNNNADFRITYLLGTLEQEDYYCKKHIICYIIDGCRMWKV